MDAECEAKRWPQKAKSLKDKSHPLFGKEYPAEITAPPDGATCCDMRPYCRMVALASACACSRGPSYADRTHTLGSHMYTDMSAWGCKAIMQLQQLEIRSLAHLAASYHIDLECHMIIGCIL